VKGLLTALLVLMIKPNSHQPKESEEDFQGRITKNKRIGISKFSSFMILSPPFEGGVAAAQ